MIQLKILSGNPDELRIIASALNQLANVAEGKGYVLAGDEMLDILKVENPVESSPAFMDNVNLPEPEVKQGTGLDPDTPEVDEDGYSWDKRIHSTAHSTNQNGTWKVLRRPKIFGDDNDKWLAFIERTRAELRGEDPDTPQEDPAAVFGGGANTENPEPEQEDPAAVFGGVGPNPEDNPASVGITFAELMKFVTSHKDKISIPKVNEICTSYGLSALSDLQSDDSMLDIIYNDLVNLVEGQ